MENEWVDFLLVKQSVSMQMVLDHYHINGLRKNGNELRGQCPIHKGEGARTFHVNVSKNVFQCFSCKAKGNILDFVAAMEQCGIRDAALKLKAWFEVGERHPQETAATERNGKQTEETKPEGPINPPLPFQLRVDPGHAYGLDRGVSSETLEYFGAGVCLSKGTFAGRFVIPLHNAQGQLVGYAGRSIDDSEPKYLFPSAEKGFYKRYLLFNLHRVIEDNDRSCIVVVEGFFSAMRLWQAGIPSVSLLGSSLTEEQEELLCQHITRVVLLFDGDDAGRSATSECLKRLGRRLWIRALSLPDQTQPDQLSTEEIRTMLASL